VISQRGITQDKDKTRAATATATATVTACAATSAPATSQASIARGQRLGGSLLNAFAALTPIYSDYQAIWRKFKFN